MRRRILLVIGTTLVAMLVIIWVTTRTILIAGFERMEQSVMQEDVERVRAALERDLAAMASIADDWAAWDETYGFAETLDPAFIKANLAEATIVNLNLDMLAFLRADGSTGYVRSLAEPPADLGTVLTRYPGLGASSGPSAGAAGLAVLDGTVWLLAAHPILTNEHAGLPHGTLVVARRLDEEEVSRLSSRVLVTVRILLRAKLPPDDPALEALSRLSAASPLVLERPDLDHLAAYAPLEDANGAPTLALAVKAASEIRRQALRSTVSSMASIAASGVVFGAVVLAFLQRSLFARLHSLSAQVLSIKTGDRPSQRLHLEGRDQLAYLAAAINGMLGALEISTEELRAQERRLQAFLDSVPDLILLIAPDRSIKDIRLPPSWTVPGLSERLRGRRADALRIALPFLSPGDWERLAAAERAARDTEEPHLVDLDLDVDGRRRSFEVRITAAVRGETVCVARDVTARREAKEAERNEVLLKEIHHRVRNNLQVISSLLALQAGTAPDKRTKKLLGESQDRIRSMALIHERLTQTSRAGELGFAAYIRDLVEHLARSYAGSPGGPHIDMELEDVPLPLDASLPAGLIMSELLTNALRHAFPGERGGHVRVTLRQGEDGQIVLTVEDDGVGLPAAIDSEAPTTLGFRIVASLVKQLRATLEIHREAGTRFRLGLPVS